MATQSQLSGIAPPPVCRNALPNGPSMRTYGADNSQRVTINSAVAGPRRKFVDEGKLRKVSERLFSDSGQRRSMRLAGESVNANSSSSIVSGNGTSHSTKYLGVGGLNSQVKLSGFTLPHYEKVTRNEGNHHEAYDDSRLNCTSLSSSPCGDNRSLEPDGATRSPGARIASPYSLEGMDIYSTVLYHLKEDTKPSYLAQELISTDRLAPQSRCAMGNCYSLQKDHETALKNFQRSVQLSSRFAYAHTLCGHEYVALEDFENGIRSYQSALRIDSRHYNAWYVLGMIYLRQEKLEFSEHHFQMAFQINPLSSVIMSYLGTALHALMRNDEALEMMERAVLADKKNPLPLYQKAKHPCEHG